MSRSYPVVVIRRLREARKHQCASGGGGQVWEQITHANLSAEIAASQTKEKAKDLYQTKIYFAR